MWGFILPNQREQTATLENEQTAMSVSLDQQRHVKKKLETSQEVRSWRQGSLFHEFFWVETELS